MTVAANADDYTVGRVNIFFPADGTTPDDGNLTGQCVTLIKWFMAEMSAVPSPFAARGDARYVGHNLVAQGLADEVSYAERRRGDIVCYEFGTYGHIAVQLSGGRVFEENVNIGAARRVLADGTVVYASRIGNESENWRTGQHVYRLKSYTEEDMYNGKTAQEWAQAADNATKIAELRAQYLAQVANAAGDNPDHPLNQDDVNKIVGYIDSLNKQVSSKGTVLAPGSYIVK